MDKKIIFFPGWMYSAEYFKLGDGLNIWSEDIDLGAPLDCEYLIGHSMGAAMALKAWSYDRSKNLILVNPFIDRKNIWNTFAKWLKFNRNENVSHEGALGFRHLPKNIVELLRFPMEDHWEILKNIPKEKIKILHGESDLFLCGNETCTRLKEIGLEIIEIPEAGHDWHKNFDNKIAEIINS
jgi:hypothetical protein